MHYIPFINEDKKNTCEVVNCKSCPLFKSTVLDNTRYVARCNYTDGDIIYFNNETDIITLSGRCICPVKYKDPIENFHYLHTTCDISLKLAATCRKIENGEYGSDEEKESLEKRKEDIMTCISILEELFPKKEEMLRKLTLEGGYNLDDDMNLYKI